MTVFVGGFFLKLCADQTSQKTRTTGLVRAADRTWVILSAQATRYHQVFVGFAAAD